MQGSWSSCIRSDNLISYVAFRRPAYLINPRSLAERHITMKTTEDLKVGGLTHQDIGQIDGYVRIYEEQFKTPGDNPTIGFILCSDKVQ